MNNLDQKADDDKIAYFREKDDETARYFKNIDFDKIDERVKVICEAFDAKKERLASCAEKKRFEEAWEEFMAECAKTKTFGICFSNQISAFEKTTGFSFIFIFFCSQWLCHQPKRSAAVRRSIKNELAPADGGSGGSGAGSAPSTSIAETEPAPEFWELGQP